MSIGRLVEVPLRDIWKHEEHNFSVWLAENIDTLSEAIGVPLTLLERETFVIENQLEQTGHDHLGKLLTYLTNLDGKKAIWIVREHREEYAWAIQWFNEFSPENIAFSLVQVKVYRIGDSAPAPSFSIIVRPSAESRALERIAVGMARWDDGCMEAYSEDLRQRIVRSVAGGMTQPEAARVFQVGERTVKRYLQQWRETGSLSAKPRPGKTPLISVAQYPTVLAQLAASPDATLAIHCETWQAATGVKVSRSLWCRIERTVGWTRKKRR